MNTKMIIAIVGTLAILSGVIFATASVNNTVAVDTTATTTESAPTCGMGGCGASCASCGGNCNGGCLTNGGCGCGCGAK